MTEAERNDSDKRGIYRKQRQIETAPETLWRDLNQLLVSYIDPFFFAEVMNGNSEIGSSGS